MALYFKLPGPSMYTGFWAYTVGVQIGFARDGFLKCQNPQPDVLLVQYLLKRAAVQLPNKFMPSGTFNLDGQLGPKTLFAIVMLQSFLVSEKFVELKVFGIEWGGVHPFYRKTSYFDFEKTFMGRLNILGGTRELGEKKLADQPDCPPALSQALNNCKP